MLCHSVYLHICDDKYRNNLPGNKHGIILHRLMDVSKTVRMVKIKNSNVTTCLSVFSASLPSVVINNLVA